MGFYHWVAAFGFGFAGSVIFLIPVLYLLSISTTLLILGVTIIFTILWWFFWTWAGLKAGFYHAGVIPFTIGSAIGFVFTLYYGASLGLVIR